MCSVILRRDVTQESTRTKRASNHDLHAHISLAATPARASANPRGHGHDTSLGGSLLMVWLLKWRYSWKHRSSGSCGCVLISAQHKQSGRWNWEALSFSPLRAVCSFNCRQRFMFFSFPSVSLSILPSLFSSLAPCSLKALCSLLVCRRLVRCPQDYSSKVTSINLMRWHAINTPVSPPSLDSTALIPSLAHT